MQKLIDQLCNLTINEELQWKTIDKFSNNGVSYSHRYQHINMDKSYFTNFNGKIYAVLYFSIQEFIFQDEFIQYNFCEIINDKEEKIDAPEEQIVKLHTIISLSNLG